MDTWMNMWGFMIVAVVCMTIVQSLGIIFNRDDKYTNYTPSKSDRPDGEPPVAR